MQTKLKLILAILVSFASKLNFYSDIVIRSLDNNVQMFSDDKFSHDIIIQTPEIKLYKKNTILPAKSIRLKKLEELFNECKEIVCNRSETSQEVKEKIKSCKIIIEKTDFKHLIAATILIIHPLDTPDDSKYPAVDAIQINLLLIAKLNLDQKNDYLTLKTLIFHELGHVFFKDVETIEKQKKEPNLNDCEALLKLINTACIENGFEPNLIKSYIQKEQINESKEMLIALIHNLQFRHNERRADLFAATMLEKGVAMQGFKRFFKLSSDIMPGYDDAAGSLKDDHDPDKLRLELFSLHSNGKIKLNLDSGKIEDVAKNKTMSPKELKYIIEKNSLDYLKGKNLILATFSCILFCAGGCFIVKANKKKELPLDDAESPNEEIDQMVAEQEA